MPEAKLIKKSMIFVVESDLITAANQAHAMLEAANKCNLTEIWEIGSIYSYTTPNGKQMAKFEFFVRYEGFRKKDFDDEAE